MNCQVDVQFCHVRYQLELVIAFPVAHQVEVVVILFENGYRLGKQHYGIWHTGFQAFVAYLLGHAVEFK